MTHTLPVRPALVPRPADRIRSLELFLVAPRWLFLKITTEQGVEGWGEPIVEGRATTVKADVEELAEYLIGKDPSRIEDLWQTLYRGGFYQGAPTLSSAISWWHRTYPCLWAERFCSVPDFLLLRWTGNLVTSYSLASWTGLLDRADRNWNAAALQAAELDAGQLPDLCDHGERLFLRPVWAERWSKLSGVPFHPDVADGATANVGDWLSAGALAVGLGSALFGQPDDEWPTLLGEVLAFTRTVQL